MAALRLLMLVCLTAPAVLTAPATAEADPGCAEGWTKFGSRCFKFISERKTWLDAEKSCLSLGANLVSIHSAEENDFISDLIKTATGSSTITWIGGSDAVQEGQWLWSDGSAWDFTSWYPGQPSNAANEHWKLWYDIPCTITYVYMCAKDAPQRPTSGPEPEPKPVSLTLEGYTCRCTPQYK
ncbi:hypothetical protein WMY93_029559 [Mugilogobius chulae]|uniref:C-type lectin domain-containing protein n=1 Tax=Mugilogobius chulae TaxID=88201 RepID=A0AAW0MNY3_9GOBI